MSSLADWMADENFVTMKGGNSKCLVLTMTERNKRKKVDFGLWFYRKRAMMME